jgi:hypothetical protein
MNYQITSFNRATGSIEVLFKDGDEQLAIYNVDLQINDNGLFIAGEELDAYLKAMFPQHIIDRRQKLAAGIANANEIEALVVPLPPPPLPEIVLPVEEVQPEATGTQNA